MTRRKLSVDELAERVRTFARAKTLGPLIPVRYWGATVDYLDCGHIVPTTGNVSTRRRCRKCIK